MRLFSKRIISNFAGDPYLVRYTIISTRWFRLFVHKILRSDDDRDLHDHPWPFWTLILWGRYTEHVPILPVRFADCKMITKSRKFGPGSLIRHRASDCHRLDLEPSEGLLAAQAKQDNHSVFVHVYSGGVMFKPVWTLFFAGIRRRDWGFHTPNGWVQWEEYVNSRKGVDVSDIEDC